LVVKSRAAFDARYGSALLPLVAGEYDGRLSNGGEAIRLVDYWAGTILDFEYDDAWYDTTDGQGYSLTVVDPVTTDPNDWGLKSTWQPSATLGGSPGAD
jgi:hypothetical protein